MSLPTFRPGEAPQPEKLAVPNYYKILAAIAAVAGIAAFVFALTQGHASLAWSSYLIGTFYTLCLGLFGVLWVAILYLSKAAWSVSMRRIPEAMSAWLIPGCILALFVGVGSHTLYHWTHAEAVMADPILRHKAPFLNMRTFFVLVGASFVSWCAFAWLIGKNSRAQDTEGGVALSQANRKLSAIFLLVYSLTFSIVAFYYLMSLEAHWFSTMCAVLLFTDTVQAGTAFVAVGAAILVSDRRLGAFLNENHLHSLGKMMFAATGFWAYIYFCQYLLIWYGNIPEETSYFIRRWENGWLVYLLVLPALKFLVPFVFMVPRDNKRKPGRLAGIALWILFAQFWEMYLLVGPSLGHGEHAAHGHLPVVEFAVTAGFLGLFFLVFAWSLGRHNAVPLKDPRLGDCLHYHP